MGDKGIKPVVVQSFAGLEDVNHERGFKTEQLWRAVALAQFQIHLQDVDELFARQPAERR